MASPTVTATLDKPSYKPGDLVTLTVNYTDPDTKTITVSVKVTDSEGHDADVGPITAIIDPLTVQASSSPAKTWTKISDTGTVAVFTATA
jgi:hypothetical protein